VTGGGGVLKVNPPVLQKAGTEFGKAGDRLAALKPDTPLGDAAGAVLQLVTAEAPGGPSRTWPR
jgi:hypothetical protein